MHSKFGLFQMSSLSLCAALSKVNFVVYYSIRFTEKSVTSVAGFSFGTGLELTNYGNIPKRIKNNENIEN